MGEDVFTFFFLVVSFSLPKSKIGQSCAFILLLLSKSFQLQFSPAENADSALVNRRFREAAGMQNGIVVWRKRSLDARGRNPFFIISAEVYAPGEFTSAGPGFALRDVHNSPQVHIVGSGPAGLFAALKLIELGFKPVVLERGKMVKERRRDLAALNKEHKVDRDSNYCFGEGGAGTYSDGKLYTRSHKRGDIASILRSLVDHGAEENIVWEAHPHIGTNKLPGIIENIRQSILDCGGEVLFNSPVVDFKLKENSIESVQLKDGSRLPVNALILATGHSARDVFELLLQKNILIEAKPFALGVRIEHPQELIDSIQYKCPTRGELLPPASYSLVEQVQGRGVFSFCMCPGGIIAPAATAPGEVVVNGWSPSKRNGKFANSGFVVAVDEKDFKPFASANALMAMRYQAHWEQKAFETAGNLTAPAQRLTDFLDGKVSSSLPSCSYIPGIQGRDLREVLHAEVALRIKGALSGIGQKYRGFITHEAVLVGVESRTSSPVRIPRDSKTLCHPQIRNLLPCGEGAGYAGGIVSAAIDGVRCALAAAENMMVNKEHG
jgi:uncharacterized FAD-dependent dehydrogenase